MITASGLLGNAPVTVTRSDDGVLDGEGLVIDALHELPPEPVPVGYGPEVLPGNDSPEAFVAAVLTLLDEVEFDGFDLPAEDDHLRALDKAKRVLSRVLHKRYDPAQPRGKDGRWIRLNQLVAVTGLGEGTVTSFEDKGVRVELATGDERVVSADSITVLEVPRGDDLHGEGAPPPIADEWRDVSRLAPEVKELVAEPYGRPRDSINLVGGGSKYGPFASYEDAAWQLVQLRKRGVVNVEMVGGLRANQRVSDDDRRKVIAAARDLILGTAE